ncbi:copper resistance system multicopper oxidase [Ferruginivarius sediminum]|uniref:Copper resistance system multicopper oxidase n=1 Tax=Ferruginivarius sediminum TaxID=2661937 RepID=A0A369TCB1_9PROT|nr:copper resistance system multicopper oxidase [Ferruginivarius sediminum]RDD62045.1 copper resistance system multicopper oxidase [Ferruginivarius sediminum]
MDISDSWSWRGLTRRRLLECAGSIAGLTALQSVMPGMAGAATALPVAPVKREGDADVIELTIARTEMEVARRAARPITINGTVPGPVVRLREGRDAVIRVTNHLDEPTSIHWHGILLPFRMDGVPGVSFPGIAPGETFTYRYPVRQSGTYWYHSHSGLQEQLGHYGALVVEPADAEPFTYDRDYVVVLSDWTFEDPDSVFRNLKVAEGYYNYQKRTVGDFFGDVREMGVGPALDKLAMWGRMRMSPRDLLDVTGSTYTYLANGFSPEANWTGFFRAGERVRLRFINASAMTYFDVQVPRLEMTVVQADGQNVEPVVTDEFRIGVAETYDVIVTPTDSRAYTIFAEAMDRSGFARATLAPREGMAGPVPERRPVPERGMAAMGMSMEMGGDMAGDMKQDKAMSGHAGMNHDSGGSSPMEMGTGGPVSHGPNDHGPGAAMVARNPRSRLDDPGVGLENAGHRVLTYAQLRSRAPWPDRRPPARDLELHLTGNMERYMWSFDGKKFSEVDGPIIFRHGERLRLTLVNDTMMDHPIHLHGMWMELDTGAGPLKPRKHTISVKPGEQISAEITADAPGDWAFHCHLLYHMKAGMFRVVSVTA